MDPTLASLYLNLKLMYHNQVMFNDWNDKMLN